MPKSKTCVTIVVLCSLTKMVFGAGPIDFIPAPNRVDMVDDTARNVLYISSTDGNLLRYNLTSKSFLDPIVLGGQPYGMDISPDGNTLVVAEFSKNNTNTWINVVNLQTENISKIQFSKTYTTPGTYSVAFCDNDTVLTSADSHLRKITLSTGSSQLIDNYTNGSYQMLSASADHSIVAVAGCGTSPGHSGRYRVSDGTMVGVNTGGVSFEIAASRNGQQYASPTYEGTYIFDQNLQQIGLIGQYASKGPIGVAYSPTSDIVYFSWWDYNHSHSRIDAYDTNTLSEVAVIDSSGPFAWTGTGSFRWGRLRTSADGSLLFATVDGGVNVYAVPEPSSIILLCIAALGLLAYTRQRK